MKIVLILLFFATALLADGVKDNYPEKVRQIPKPGIELKDDQKEHFTKRNSQLEKLIGQIQKKNNPMFNQLLPDIQIFHNAVKYALEYNEFLSPKDLKKTDQILDEGIKRAENLLNGKAPWLNQKGLVVRGFVSKIDKSVQPYGLVIPESYNPDNPKSYRTDIWLHGRNENILEVNFIHQRMHSAGQFSPADTIVLHPYGRYSNAFKFAGEVDVFEALEHAQKWYKIDADRISNRGFSMGGAGCWQLAVHYSDSFFASNPGAGFSETPDFLKVFQQQDLQPKWFEKVLWRWYDCPDYSVNLKQCPTIAYSGEVDRQIQAAQMMEKGHEKEGMKLLHIIGPKMGHKYDPESAKKVDAFIAEKAKEGLIKVPKEIHFVTYTLKYNHMKWITVTGLKEHWQKSRIDAELGSNAITVKTSNIKSFELNFTSGLSPFKIAQEVSFNIDGQTLTDSIGTLQDKSLKICFTEIDGKWVAGSGNSTILTKKHNLQGPVDDAFMSSFIFVKPTGKSSNTLFQQWQESEFNRAVKHWRQHFRGDAIIKSDMDVTPRDIAESNLILWGDIESNKLIGRLAEKLPIKWSNTDISVKDKKYDARDHALIMIYPNPLNQEKYIVLNSSFTYREFAYLNNARQVPMLPDWAVIDLTVKPGTIWPGKVSDANFFDESWMLK